MKILILSGGGSHGAYQVGVLKRLIEQGQSWDVIAGVSVGALNGAYLAMHNKSNITEGMRSLEEIWMDIKGTKDIIKPWWPWIFNYLPAYFKGSLNSTKPLLRLIESKFDSKALQESDVDLRVGTVALGTGRYVTIGKHQSNFPTWILASSAMPVVMPPVEIDGDRWVDGGVRNQTPVISVMDVIESCKVSGESVTVDIILTGPTHNEVLAVKQGEISNLMQVALRCAQLAIDEIYLTDLDKILSVAGVKVYEPVNPIKMDSMQFNPKDLSDLIHLGYAETLARPKFK